jgi:hypothetical protein
MKAVFLVVEQACSIVTHVPKAESGEFMEIVFVMLILLIKMVSAFVNHQTSTSKATALLS